MTTIFISQPMRGRTEKEIRDEREKITKSLKAKIGGEVDVINSLIEGAPKDANPLWCLGRSLQLMSKADIIFFANGWENARGCIAERYCAESYDYLIIEEDLDVQ